MSTFMAPYSLCDGTRRVPECLVTGSDHRDDEPDVDCPGCDDCDTPPPRIVGRYADVTGLDEAAKVQLRRITEWGR